MNFMLHKCCDMCLILGDYGNWVNNAARSYAEWYPAHCHPDNNVVYQLDKRLREIDSILPAPPLGSGRLHSLDTGILPRDRSGCGGTESVLQYTSNFLRVGCQTLHCLVNPSR